MAETPTNIFADHPVNKILAVENQFQIVPIFGTFVYAQSKIIGWSVQNGYPSDTIAETLGNYNDSNLIYSLGGIMAYKDCKIEEIDFWYNVQVASNLEGYGFVFSYQEKTDASATVTTTFLRDEGYDRGEGHYGLTGQRNTGLNYRHQLSKADFVDHVIPKGAVINMGITGQFAAVKASASIIAGYIKLKIIS